MKVVSALLTVNGVWITMMRDVVRFLETCGVSMRTTGCVLILPIDGGESKSFLSPQVADMIARFDAAARRRKTGRDWSDSLSTFHRLEWWIRQTAQDGLPSKYDVFDDGIMHKIALGLVEAEEDLYRQEVRVDPLASEKMFSLWRSLDYLSAKLSAIGDRPSDPAARELKDVLSQCALQLSQHIERLSYDYDLWDELTRYVNPEPWSETWSTEEIFKGDCWRYDEHWDEWVRFIEDVLSIAEFEKSPEVADLLRLDLLKDRPRLFEVWCMSRILSWYRSWRCAVELESIKADDPPVWNLNYSKASEPVARVEHGADRWWFFFQLFRTGGERANMPDLALLTGRDPSSDVIWIADPKYSEAGGYDHHDYLEVAERYRDAFHTRRVWICEFFARRDWFGGASYEHGDRVSILTEVQPKGEGSRLLRRELRQVHGFSSKEFVLAIDCSGSFIDNLPSLEPEIVALSNRAAAILCFAGTAKEIDPESVDLAAMRSESESLVGGTLLGPLVSELESLSSIDSCTELILVTDGGFSDHSSALSDKLGRIFSNVEQVADAASLARVVAERCAVRSKENPS